MVAKIKQEPLENTLQQNTTLEVQPLVATSPPVATVPHVVPATPAPMRLSCSTCSATFQYYQDLIRHALPCLKSMPGYKEDVQQVITIKSWFASKSGTHTLGYYNKILTLRLSHRRTVPYALPSVNLNCTIDKNNTVHLMVLYREWNWKH